MIFKFFNYLVFAKIHTGKISRIIGRVISEKISVISGMLVQNCPHEIKARVASQGVHRKVSHNHAVVTLASFPPPPHTLTPRPQPARDPPSTPPHTTRALANRQPQWKGRPTMYIIG